MKLPLEILDWAALGDASRAAVLRRPTQHDAADRLEQVRLIVNDVRVRGDEVALHVCTSNIERNKVTSVEVRAASAAGNTVAPLNVTSRIGMWTPVKRSRMPPLGRFGLDSNTKLTIPAGGCAIRSDFSMPAMAPLWE
mgnify:CR=1 FL=1